MLDWKKNVRIAILCVIALFIVWLILGKVAPFYQYSLMEFIGFLSNLVLILSAIFVVLGAFLFIDTHVNKVYHWYLISAIRDYIKIIGNDYSNAKIKKQSLNERNTEYEKRLTNALRKNRDKTLIRCFNSIFIKKHKYYKKLVWKLFDADKDEIKDVITTIETEIENLADKLHMQYQYEYREAKMLIECFKSVKKFYSRDIFICEVSSSDMYGDILIYTDVNNPKQSNSLVKNYIKNNKLHNESHNDDMRKLLSEEYSHIVTDKRGNIWIGERTDDSVEINIGEYHFSLKYNEPTHSHDVWDVLHHRSK